jgi:AcrR family transcriptional regulator
LQGEWLRRLPPGPHGLPPELVERNQRERLIAAMAEVCGERGYAESSVAEVAKRAGVSTASFYRQFKDRRECMLASFEELFGRLLAGVEAACGGEADRPDRARAMARATAELLAGDPPTARLLSIEILACGERGVRAQQQAIERFAALLRGEEEPPLPDSAWAISAAIFTRVGTRAAEGEAPAPAELEAISTLL